MNCTSWHQMALAVSSMLLNHPQLLQTLQPSSGPQGALCPHQRIEGQGNTTWTSQQTNDILKQISGHRQPYTRTTHTGYWLIGDQGDWRGELYYWIKTFLETLKSPWIYSSWQWFRHAEQTAQMPSLLGWGTKKWEVVPSRLFVSHWDKMNSSDLAFNNKHTQHSRRSINAGTSLFPLFLKVKTHQL